MTVDTSQLDSAIERLVEKLGSLGEVYAQCFENRTIPELQSKSASERKVRTGRYSTTWEAEAQDEESAVITTEAQYWIWLERGNSRGLVGKPVVLEALRNLASDLREFVSNAIEEVI